MKKTYNKPFVHIYAVGMGNLLAGSYKGEARSKGLFDDMSGGTNRSGDGPAIGHKRYDAWSGGADGTWGDEMENSL